MEILDPDYMVVLYENIEFGGLPVNVTSTIHNMSDAGYNDWASSLQVVKE